MNSAFQNPILRKFLSGITGIGLTLFVLMHMIGNLSYFNSDPDAYNRYSHALLSLGPLLWAVEIGLLVFFLAHTYIGISIALKTRAARPVGYAVYKSAGPPSRQSAASRSMIATGLVLLGFIIIHLLSFKYGPGMEADYTVVVDGVEMRDLKRLLEEKFRSPQYAFGYLTVMVLLATHLRHGFWSALQSLGAMSPRATPFAYGFGLMLGILIAVGFFVLPMYIYFDLGGA